ncbi:hypothetical protein AB7W72_24225, partial [Providencia rettgeri]
YRQLELAGRTIPDVYDVMSNCVRHTLDAVHRFYCPLQSRAQRVGWPGVSHQPDRRVYHGCTDG